MQHVIANAAT